MSSEWWNQAPKVLRSTLQKRFNAVSVYSSELSVIHMRQKRRPQKLCPLTFQPKRMKLLADPTPQLSNLLLSLCTMTAQCKLRPLTNYKSLTQLQQLCMSFKAVSLVEVCQQQIKLLFYYLYGEVSLSTGSYSLAAENLQFAEYYARKISRLDLVTHLLLVQAKLCSSLFDWESSIRVLQNALQVSYYYTQTVIEKEEVPSCLLPSYILENLGIAYYSCGNVGLSQYYHDQAKNTTKSGVVRKYQMEEGLGRLENRLFEGEREREGERGDIRQLSEEISQNGVNNAKKQSQFIREMLRCHRDPKRGESLKRQIISMNRVSVIKLSSSQKPMKRTPFLELPLQNNAQVIKSHLSRNRVNAQISNENIVNCIMSRLKMQQTTIV